MGEVLHGREMEVEHREEEDNKDKEEEEEEDNEGGAVLHGREMEVLTSIAWEKYCMGGVLHGKSIAWEGDGSVRTFRPRAALPPSFPQRQHASSFQRIAPLLKTKMDRLAPAGINCERLIRAASS